MRSNWFRLRRKPTSPIRLHELESRDAASATLVADVNVTIGSGNVSLFRHAFEDRLLFHAFDAKTSGAQLWATDGTTVGTVPLSNSVGSFTSIQTQGSVHDGKFFFYHPASGLHRYDGGSAPPVLIDPIISSNDAGASNFASAGGKLFFSAQATSNGLSSGTNYGQELWISDGTDPGTYPVLGDFIPGTTGSSPYVLTVSADGNYLFFTAKQAGVSQSYSLHVATQALTNLTSHTANVMPASAYLSFAGSDGKLYFSASTLLTGRELFTSDGTSAGTLPLVDLFPGPNSGFFSGTTIVPNAGRIYFAGNNYFSGRELFSARIPSPPSAIHLSKINMPENSPGYVLGTLSASDFDPGDTFTFEFAPGGKDNHRFSISGNTITAIESFDYETQPVLFTRIRVTDSVNFSYEQNYAVYVANIDEPNVSFAAAGASAVEGDVVTVTVTLEAAVAKDAVIPLILNGGTLISEQYSLSSKTVTIPAGQTSSTFSIALPQDAAYETTHTLKLRLGTPNPDSATEIGGPSEFTLTVTDEDPLPIVSWVDTIHDGTEDVNPNSMAISLSAPAGEIITIPYTLSGTAIYGKDFTASGIVTATTGNVIILAGHTAGYLNISLLVDFDPEVNETVVVTLGSPLNASLTGPDTATLTIRDNDRTVRFTTDKATHSEAGGPFTVTATLDIAEPSGLTVPLAIGGTATAADYSIYGNALSFAPGSTTASVVITPVNDSLYRGQRTLFLSLLTPSEPLILPAAPSAFKLTLIDDEPAPTVSFSATTQTFFENAGNQKMTIAISQAVDIDIVVPVVYSGTAINAIDYLSNGFVNAIIPAGKTSVDITYGIIDDAVAEVNETIIVTLGPPPQASLGAIAQHTVTIRDNDRTVSLLSTMTSKSESASPFEVTVSTPTPPDVDLVVPFTYTGTGIGPDVTFSANQFVIPAGQTKGSITATIIDDTLFEYTDSTRLTLGTPDDPGVKTAAPSLWDLEILDNDPMPVVTLGSIPAAIAESAGSLAAPVLLSAESGVDTKINIALGALRTNWISASSPPS